MQAVIAGNIQRVKEIVRTLKKNSCGYLIDLATEDDGFNMLHFAVCYKRLQIVKYLIENGASKSTHTHAHSCIYTHACIHVHRHSFTLSH